MTRAQIKKLNSSNGNEDNGTVAYMEEALKNKFEEFGDKGETSNSHPTANGSPTPTIVGRKGGDSWKEVESKIQSKVDLHQSGIRETSTWRFYNVLRRSIAHSISSKRNK
ncbi:hypothetical protein M9H77_07486 [Catharanthus roseus]|uniref:Uncharacterized protein n=1 Tax=Catharanthus roseus TaxID=4058 RepID=A0ACC0BV55_CATRO|nr:hypothetical protein M9H77_07486 [Catharanthus roseus]